MRKSLFKIFIIICAITVLGISVNAQTPVGYVVEIEGNWVLNRSHALSEAEKLPAGGSIRRQSSSRDDRITIADMRGNILASRNCENGNCSRVINLPRTAPSNSLLGEVVGSLMEWFRTSPRRKDLNQSRSGELSEDVVKLTDGEIDLSSVLKMQGEQYLRWRVISQKEDITADWTKPIKLDKTALVSGFQPGLYEINLMRSNGSNFEPVASSWILVATQVDYKEMRASFQEVQKLTKNWGDKVKPETTRLFLQASLDNLARKTVK